MPKDGAVKAGRKYCSICNTWVPFSVNKKHRLAHMDEIVEKLRTGMSQAMSLDSTAANAAWNPITNYEAEYKKLQQAYQTLQDTHQKLRRQYDELKQASIHMGKAFVSLISE